MEPILIATGVMTIPFTFLVIAWKKRPTPKWLARGPRWMSILCFFLLLWYIIWWQSLI
jgi:hypothetical protein